MYVTAPPDTGSEPQGPGPPQAIQLHSLHYADANEAEVEINELFFRTIEDLFRPGSSTDVQSATDILIDFIAEARKQERLEDRGSTHQIADVDLSIRDMLVHTPLQHWPLPHVDNCPCSFCDECVTPEEMEQHLAIRHSYTYYGGLYYSQVQLQIAGLLGMGVRVTKQRKWKCPFGYCPREFDNYAEVGRHVNLEHERFETTLYSRVGGFWASLLRCFMSSGRWPTVLEIFTSDQERVRIDMAPLPRMTADILWKQGERRLTHEQLVDTRVLPGTPLEPLLRRFRRDASAQSSRETSAPRGSLGRNKKKSPSERRDGRGNRPGN